MNKTELKTRLDDSDILWPWALHEDGLFDSRVQIFLTTHGLMLAGAGFIFSAETVSRPALYLMSLLGIGLAIVWAVIQRQSELIVDKLEQKLAAIESSPFEIVFQELEKENPRLFYLSRNKILSRILPMLLLVWWVALAVVVRWGW